MNAISGTVKNGQILLDQPVAWPEGTRVEVMPSDKSMALQTPSEDDDSEEAITRRLALMDQIEPLLMTPEEEAEWQAARKAQKEFEKAGFDARSDRLRRMWE